ncbi:hypothetical protein D3C79_573550 [compost metagenome]
MLELGEEDLPLRVVDLADTLQQAQRHAAMLGSVQQGAQVLGKARTAKAATRVDKVIADARVGADALAHGFDVGAQVLGEVGQLVHEADARGEHGVGRVLGQLGAAVVHEHELFMIAAEGRVELGKLVMGLVVGGADDDPVRAHAIGQRAAFFKELGVGHHPYLQRTFAQALQFVAGQGGDLVGGTDRHGGLDDQGAVGVHQPGDLPGHPQDMGEVGRAVFVRRRADGNEDQFGVVDGVTGLGTEQQAAFLDVFFEHARKAGFADWRYALTQLTDLVRINIDAQNPVSYVCEGCSLYKTDIAGAKYAHVHVGVPRME